MSLEYIRRAYSLPKARRGARVEVIGGFAPQRQGAITGARGTYLRVVLDGESAFRLVEPHQVRFLED